MVHDDHVDGLNHEFRLVIAFSRFLRFRSLEESSFDSDFVSLGSLIFDSSSSALHVGLVDSMVS